MNLKIRWKMKTDGYGNTTTLAKTSGLMDSSLRQWQHVKIYEHREKTRNI